MRLLLLLTLLCSSVTLHAGRSSPDWSTFENLVEEGLLQDALSLLLSWSQTELPSEGRLRYAAERQKLLYLLGRYEEARRAGESWLSLADGLGEPAESAKAHYWIALALLARQDLGEAVRHLEEGLQNLDPENGHDGALELNILLKLAYSKIGMGNYRDSERLLERAEELWHRDGEESGAGADLWQRRGSLRLETGNYPGAVPLLERALELARVNPGNGELVRTVLTNLSQAHMRLNNWSEAIRLLEEAIQGSSRPPSISMATLGICYFEINQFEKAREIFEQVLETSRDGRNLTLQAWAISELAMIANVADRDPDRALSLFDQSIDMFGRAQGYRNQALMIENKAHLLRDLGHFELALNHYQESWRKMRQLGLPPTSPFLKGKGQCLAGLGRVELAIEAFGEALQAARREGDDKRIWQTHWELARLLGGQGRLDESRQSFEAAIEQIEESRRELSLASFKTDFFQDKVQVYEEYVDLLVMRLGEPREAFNIAERARARSFLDSLAEARSDLDATLPAEIRDTEAQLLAQISLLQAELRNVSSRADLKDELREKERELERFYVGVRHSQPNFHAFRYPEPLDLGALQAELAPSEVALGYLIGQVHSHLWIVSRHHVRHHLLPDRETLETEIRKVYRTLLNPESAPGDLEELGRLLIAGDWGALKPFRSIIIIPSGLLFYFPFEALRNGDGTLGDLAETVYVPSTSVLHYLRSAADRAAPSPRLLAVAGARYSDGDGRRSTSSWAGPGELGDLPHTAQEASSVRSLFGRAHSTLLAGENATEANVKGLDLSQFSVVHLATHGWIDPLFPSRSGVVLGLGDDSGEDGVLQSREIFRLRLNAQLVTLSACQTALGRLVTGEGMVGLTQAFFFAGSRSVVASLWSVNDEATARFMELFYGNLAQGLPKSDALRQARQALQREEKYRHPYFWAPYILIGDGRERVMFPPSRRLVWLLSGAGLASLVAFLVLWLRRRRNPATSRG